MNSSGRTVLASQVKPNPYKPNMPQRGREHAALVVVAGKGLGQIRTLTSFQKMKQVTIDELSLEADEFQCHNAPFGQWIVAGNTFVGGTSVQTYGITYMLCLPITSCTI